MADSTPAKKSPARKPAARKASAAAPAEPATEPIAAPEQSTGGDASAAPAGEVQASSAPRSRSILDSVRGNRMGPLVASLTVAVLVGLLLSVLVPDEPGALALTILGALVAAAVGVTVRYLSEGERTRHQVEAFLAAGVGVHLMSVTGMVGGDLPVVSELGIDGPGFNEALLVALASAPVSTGGLLAGLTAAIIVGWGPRRDGPRSH